MPKEILPATPKVAIIPKIKKSCENRLPCEMVRGILVKYG